MSVTLREIAEIANVSTSTASLALSGKKTHRIPLETVERVREVARQAKYQPNRAARSLRTGRSNVVAVLIQNILAGMVHEVLYHLRRLASESGFELVVVSDVSSDTAAHWMVDGVIALDSPVEVSMLRKGIASAAIPLVSIGTFPFPDDDYFGVDLYSGCVVALNHLIETGRKRIVLLTIPNSDKPWEPRRKAYADVMRSAHLTETLWLTEGGELREDAYQCVLRQDIIQNVNAPDALFCMNDQFAIGALRAVAEMGVKVPEDIAIVGVDGVQELDYHNPKITSIRQPFEELCELGWARLMNKIENPGQAIKQITLDTELVIRDSSAPKVSLKE